MFVSHHAEHKTSYVQGIESALKPHIYSLQMLLCSGVLHFWLQYACTYTADRFRGKSCSSSSWFFSL